MSKVMKSFVMHGIGQVGIVEKPIPQSGPSDAIIRTTAALMMQTKEDGMIKPLILFV